MFDTVLWRELFIGIFMVIVFSFQAHNRKKDHVENEQWTSHEHLQIYII